MCCINMEPQTSQFCKGCSYLMTAIISILLIICYTIYVIARAADGAKFTKGDIVCAAILITFGTFILIVMLVCLCMETQFCKHKNERVITVISRRLKRVTKISGDTCAICLDEKNSQEKTVVKLSCGHTFHKSCIRVWLPKKIPPNCPECRQPSRKFSTTVMFREWIHLLSSQHRKQQKMVPETVV